MDYKALAQKHGGEAPASETLDFADIAKRFGGRTAAFKEGFEKAPGALQGLLSGVQGPTFGFADEIVGGIGAPIRSLSNGRPVAENYRDIRDFVRGMTSKQEEENPVSSMVTRGMVAAPTMAFGRANQAAGMLNGAITSAKAGGVTGAIGGLGNSTAVNPLGMALDTAKGGAIGASMGAAVVPVARGMGGMYENVASRFNESAAMRYAREKVAEALVRDARGNAVRANPSAPFQQAASRFEKLGEEARVVDAGGQNTRQLLDTLTTLPGQTKPAAEAAIRSRQAGRADRLIGSAERSLGTGGERASAVVDDLIGIRSRTATPLYGRLHRMEVDADPELAGMLNAAEKLGAGKVARDIAEAAQVPYSLSAQAWQASGGKLAMRDLDHMKQGLDTLIQKQTDPAGKLSPLGFQLQGLRQRLLSRLDDATGGFYAEARNAFAGPSALIDASNRGRRFMTADDAATRQALAGLSESEREAFRLGAFEALRNKLGRPGGQTETLGMWKDKILREKLQAIFPTERAFREFAATASKEATMKGLEGVGRGSQTASRQYGAGDMDTAAVMDTVQSLSGATGIPGMLAAVGRNWNRVQTPEPVRDAMGRMLLSQGGAGRNALSDIEEAVRIIAMRRNRNANALGVGLGNGPTNALASILTGQQ